MLILSLIPDCRMFAIQILSRWRRRIVLQNSDSLNTFSWFLPTLGPTSWMPIYLKAAWITLHDFHRRSNMCFSWSPESSTTSTQSSIQSCTQSSQSAFAEASRTYLESAGFTRSHFTFFWGCRISQKFPEAKISQHNDETNYSTDSHRTNFLSSFYRK